MSIGAPQYKDQNTEEISGTKTLVANDAYLQFIDPGGTARIIVLPALAVGLEVVIANRADGAEIITVNDALGSTVATPTQNETVTCYCNGTEWAGQVGDDN